MYRLTRVYIQGRIGRREITPETGDRIRSVLTNFATSFGERTVANLSASDIERWLTSRAKKRIGTRRYEISTVRSFVTWLIRKRHLRRDPMIDIKAPPAPRRVPRALSRTENTALRDILPDIRARAIHALMRGLGLRRCEVLRCEVGDWDRTSRTLLVTGKGGHQRLVPVTERAEVVLDEYLCSIGAVAGPMIRRLDGTGTISNGHLGKLMRGWMEDAGIKRQPYDGRACHSLRHTLASEVAGVETDLRVIQELLGHANLSSTQIYLRRTTIGRVRAAMEAEDHIDDQDPTEGAA